MSHDQIRSLDWSSLNASFASAVDEAVIQRVSDRLRLLLD